MGHARHPLSLIALLAVAAAMSAGCGSADETSPSTSDSGGATHPAAPAGATARTCTLDRIAGVGRARVSGVDCAQAGGIVASWSETRACGMPAGSSRASCPIGAYRCLAAATERGLAVNCAAPGRSISFVARRG